MKSSVNATLSVHQKTFLKILMNHYNSLKKRLDEIEINLEADMAHLLCKWSS